MVLFDRLANARAGLYPTIWPLEHADRWRTQCAPDGGLPSSFDPASLMLEVLELDQPMLGYTRDQDEVFVLGGMPFTMGMFTQGIIQNSAEVQMTLDDLLENLEQTPYIAKINPLTLEYRILYLNECHAVNYPGGLLMHQNGLIYAVARSVLYKIDPGNLQILRSVKLPLVEDGMVGRFTIYNGLQVMADGDLVTKSAIAKTNPNEGWLLRIDPDTLDFRAAQRAHVCTARMCLAETQEGLAYLFAPDKSESRRFQIGKEEFSLDQGWSAEYRQPNAGVAGGPLFMRSHVVFPDNGVPGATTAMQIYRHPLINPPKKLTPHPAVSNEIGVNFWKVLGDPFTNDHHGMIVTFVPMNGLVAAYRLESNGDLSLVWEKELKLSASPAAVPSRDLLYVDDYSNGQDHFVVLRMSTGEELTRIALPANEPTMGIIFPGALDDVYLLSTQSGTKGGYFNRIHLPAVK